VYVPCYPLEGNSLTQWVSQQMRAVGLSADPANCKLLCDFCEGNLLAAKQEIDKLALLHPDGSLTTQDIESSVVDQSKYNVFQLVDVLLSGDAQRTIKLLYRLESEGVEPNIILWALVREWQTLQNLTFSQQQGKSINWNQFRIWKNRQGLYRSAMQRLSIEQLDKIQQKLAFLDKALKQSVVPRPYIEICHICLLFMPYDLDEISLA
jgi:DNA polymerase-3 subunit delta